MTYRWNRCDVCGQFIAMSDFNKGARRKLVYPASELTSETWETLCVKHSSPHHCKTCKGRGYLVVDVKWPSGGHDRYAVQCSVCQPVRVTQASGVSHT